MANEGKGCEACERLKRAAREAAAAYDRSSETDARVLLRRHMRQMHGTDLPLSW
jgi:hypothetical protein